MPTTTEYSLLATRFETRAATLQSLPLRFVTGLDGGNLTGRVAETIDDTFQVSARHLSVAAELMRELATICRNRADACLSYSYAVDRYYRQLADLEPSERRPNPPVRQAWMEYGR